MINFMETIPNYVISISIIKGEASQGWQLHA